MKLAFVMDPISQISYKKDSTLAMMVEAQEKGHEISVENKLVGGYGPISTIYKNSDKNFIGVPDIRVGTEKAFNNS